MRSLQLNPPGQAEYAPILRAVTVLCLLFAVMILSGSLCAAEEGIKVLRGMRDLPERGAFPEFVVVNPASRVSVLPPRNSETEIDSPARRLKFQLPDYAGMIVLQFPTNRFGLMTAENQDEFLQLVRNRFPGATVRAAGVAHFGSGLGLAFDVERITQYKTRLTTRLAFVSSPDGVLEASMTASSDNFPSLQRTFTTFLGCLLIRPPKGAGDDDGKTSLDAIQYLAAEKEARQRRLQAEQQAAQQAATTFAKVPEFNPAIVGPMREMAQTPVTPLPEPIQTTQNLLSPGFLIRGFLWVLVASVLVLYFNRKFGLWVPTSRPAEVASTHSLLDEQALSEFFRALQTGSTGSLAGTRAGAAGSATHSRALTNGEGFGVATEPVRDFYNLATGRLACLRSLFSEVNCAVDKIAQQKKLQELFEQASALRQQAELPELLVFWQVTFAFEGLLKRLSMKAAEVTPSALRTAAGGLDLLVDLCSHRPKPNLVNEPPLRLLVVDDDPISRRAMSLALAKLFEEPDLAQDGPAALALAGRQTYDAIFLDVEMPGMDGFELCTKIHETALNRNTPVVFVTRHGDFDSRAKSSLSGGYSLMAKPFLVFEVVLKAITLVLRGRLHQPGAEGSPEAAAEKGPQVTLQVERSVSSSGPAAVAPSAPAVSPAPSSAQELPRNGKDVEQAPDSSSNTSCERGLADFSKVFFARMPARMQQLRKQLELLAGGTDAKTRLETLGEIYLGIHTLVIEADRAELRWGSRLGSALRSLLQKLLKNPERAVPSALNAAGAALDAIERLCHTGAEPELINPPIRILVVDDDPLARRTISAAVQLAFAKPDNAESGEMALALAAEKPFDVIFMDVLMPGMDGFSACVKIHETKLNHHTPIIFVSSNADAKAGNQATDSGGSGLISKAALPIEITLAALTFTLRSRLEELKVARNACGESETLGLCLRATADCQA